MSATANRAGRTTFVELRPGEVSVGAGPSAPVPAGWARIAVRATALCGTDLHLLEGMRLPRGAAYPVRPGHEVAGDVTELGEGAAADITPGAAVVLHPLAPCGRCDRCLAGDREACADMRVLGLHLPGGLATEVLWPADRLAPTPGLDPVRAAVLADAVATARRALAAANLPPGGRLCVVGAGGVGTHVLELARLLDPSAQLAGVVRSPASARRLAEAGFDAAAGADGMRRLRRGGLFDAVVDFSGDPGAPADAVRLLRPRGTLVFGSLLTEDLRLGPAQRVQTRELTVAGVYCSTMAELREVAALACDGRLDLSHVVTHVFTLADAPAAFQTLRDRPAGMFRVAVTPGGATPGAAAPAAPDREPA